MKLIVGDVSSWSMRAWMCLKLADIEFEEIVIPLGAPGYKEVLAQYSKSMLVPVLDTGETKIHDSLAIAEYCNEISDGKLLPADLIQRAECRSLCSELHSGFSNIRGACPFSWKPVPLEELNDGVQRDLERLEYIWSQSAGEYYYCEPTIVDAFYSVMAYRLYSYDIVMTELAARYQKHLLDWSLFTSALERAKAWPEMKA